MTSTPRTIACIVGARPNFMKVAPILRALRSRPGLQGVLIHTGQHYDRNMSAVFLEELDMPAPDHHLNVGSGKHGEQTARIMMEFEGLIEGKRPDLVLVVGDVNSTIACSLVAAKMGIPVAHVEAGLRSFDRAMPEEINRVLTDQLSDLLFITEESARKNLQREGIDPAKVHFTGNTMIDTLVHLLPRIEDLDMADQLGLTAGAYAVVTFHRPSNVDDSKRLAALVDLLAELGERVPVAFPVHPRTRGRLEEAGLWDRLQSIPGLLLQQPLGYLQFMSLTRQAQFVLTDSGGIQEETTFLGVPCLTQRTSTERPITMDKGTNVLLGESFERTREEIAGVLAGKGRKGEIPPLWDGRCAERIADVLEERLA